MAWWSAASTLSVSHSRSPWPPKRRALACDGKLPYLCGASYEEKDLEKINELHLEKPRSTEAMGSIVNKWFYERIFSPQERYMGFLLLSGKNERGKTKCFA